MHNLLNKVKQNLITQSVETRNVDKEIPISDIYRFRKQRGVNLGSWFVLERWITDSPFKDAKPPGQSDLDSAHGANAKQILEHHWDTWIEDGDWEWLVEHGINSIRIPIGYYHVCGADPAVLQGTDFQPFYDVYSGAWSRIVKAVQNAASRSMGILINVHAAPGKQNNDTHAGTSDRANFFGDKHNQNCTLRVLTLLIEHLQRIGKENIIGIELLNEPHPPSDQALKKWYNDAISTVRSLDSSIPIYLGDCWRPDTYGEFISQHGSSGPLVLDHHMYRCFTLSDIATSVQQHCRAISDPSASFSQTLAHTTEKIGRAGGVVIGEWSGTLNPGSLRGVPNEQREFVDSQLRLYERLCAGWFFWTYKKEHGVDTGWSFRNAVENGVFPEFVGIRRRKIEDSAQERDRRTVARDNSKKDAFDAHVRYWSNIQGSYNHPLFEAGYKTGWDDAYSFMSATTSLSPSVNELGFRAAWAKKRCSDHGKHYWEFEHGFLQGATGATTDYQNIK